MLYYIVVKYTQQKITLWRKILKETCHISILQKGARAYRNLKLKYFLAGQECGEGNFDEPL